MTVYNSSYYDALALNPVTPLTHCRIGYDNLIKTVTATSSQAGFTADALDNPFTYEIWKPATLPADIIADMGQGQAIDYVAFAAHEFKNCRLVASTSMDGTNYTEQADATILDDNSIMLLFAEVQARYVKVTITGYAVESTFVSDFANGFYAEGTYSASSVGSPSSVSCSVMYAGKALAMQRMIYGGHSPGTLSRDTKLVNNSSEGGQWLGRSVVRSSLTNNFSFNNLTADWYRTNFDDFVKSAQVSPFFIAWRPDSYANEVIYGRTDSDIRPENQGIKNFLSVSFGVTGYNGA